MKREELKEMNVPEEAIDKIMGINGKDIEKAKSDYEAVKTQLETMQTQLDEANIQIEEFKSMDIDGVKAACEDWKTKAETAKQEKEKFIHETKVKQYVEKLALKDDVYEKHVTNMLLEKGLRFDGETLLGADDVINPFKEGHPEAFKGSEERPHFVDNTGTSQTSALTRAEFEKLPYLEKYKLKTEQPDTYNRIKAETNGG